MDPGVGVELRHDAVHMAGCFARKQQKNGQRVGVYEALSGLVELLEYGVGHGQLRILALHEALSGLVELLEYGVGPVSLRRVASGPSGLSNTALSYGVRPDGVA